MTIPSVLMNLQKNLDISREKSGAPGASIAVLYEGEIYRAASGIANIETQVPVTPNTLFHIGSVTKLFTATLVMQLVEQGKVDLDTAYCHYVPEFELQDEYARKNITVRHLLNHSSGIMGDFYENTGRGDDCLEKYAQSCKKLSTVHDVGACFSYCNAGFSLLGRLIEKLTGEIWEVALSKYIFKPMEMHYCSALPEDELRFHSAIGHLPEVDWPEENNGKWKIDGKYLRSIGPAGSTVAMSPTELVKFAKMYLDDGLAGNGTRILSKDSIHNMLEPQIYIPYSLRFKAWGLGWMRFDWNNKNVIGHDGGTANMATFMRVMPDENTIIALTANGGDTGAIIFRDIFVNLLKELVDVELPPDPKPEENIKIDLEKYVGCYRRYGMEIDVKYQNGNLSALVSSRDGEDNIPVPTSFAIKPLNKDIFQLFISPDMPPMNFNFINFNNEGRPRHVYSMERVLKRMD